MFRAKTTLREAWNKTNDHDTTDDGQPPSPAVLLLALLCLMPRQAAAQQAHLQGTVTDDTGSPLELAVVRLEGTGIGTVTNLQGHYSLSFQTSDTVTVVFSMMGFETRKRKLVRPQGNLTINITLPIMNYELGEVSITERRRQTQAPCS